MHPAWLIDFDMRASSRHVCSWHNNIILSRCRYISLAFFTTCLRLSSVSRYLHSSTLSTPSAPGAPFAVWRHNKKEGMLIWAKTGVDGAVAIGRWPVRYCCVSYSFLCHC